MKPTDNQSQKLYYTMGEVSELLDVSQSLLRFWEKEFDEIRPRRNKKGNRLFTKQDVQTLKQIYHLVKEKGLKIAAAKRQLKLGDTQELSREAMIVEKLHSIRAILLEVKQSLDVDVEEVDDQQVIVEGLEVKNEITNADSVENVVSEPMEHTQESVDEQSEAEQSTIQEEKQAEDSAKPKAPRKPRPKRPKYAFKEVELFSLDELDAMQPKPGERRGNDEVQQTLF